MCWDEAYEHLYGPPPDSTEQGFKWWLRRVHPDDRPAVLRCIFGAQSGSARHWKCKYRFRRRDGSYAFVLDRALIFRDENGKPERILGTLLDLTERKQAMSELEEANRLKDQFLALVSHELRNPVHAIAGWISLLRGHKLDKKAEARAFEIIEQNARYEARLIEDLVDISRILTGRLSLKLNRLNLSDLVRCAAESFAPMAASKNIQVDLILEEVGWIAGDSHRLRQILVNLLSNALKFTPVGGRIAVSLKKTAGSAELVISDSGIGIPPELLPRIFEHFWQMEKPASRDGGLGLGLAIAAHLLELHGGAISIDSKGPGKGTTAKVTLPLVSKGFRPSGKWIPMSVRSFFQTSRSGNARSQE
jgi:PAS domain S-box-containing protein